MVNVLGISFFLLVVAFDFATYGSTAQEIRLADGNSGSGRVEVFYNGEWGTVCDDLWDINDARVACKQLGYPDAIESYGNAYFGAGSGQIWLDNVQCDGEESSLSDCSHNGFGSHNCGHSEDAGVRCQVNNVQEIRLAGGNSVSGRVEVFYNGEWGTVCDDFWDINDARVACKQLGYHDAIESYRNAFFGAGSGQIWLDNVQCDGEESSLSDCSHNGFGSHNCGHSEDAGVRCQVSTVQEIRLAGGNSVSGRVEVFYNGEWGTVCDDLWDINDARVACKQLGYPDAIESYGNAYFGAGSGQIWLDNVQCNGEESSLSDCSHNGFGSHNCIHSEDAGVLCGGQTCGGTLNGLSGEITSPGYPYAYSANGNCIWTIEASSEKVVELTVHFFALQDSLRCSSDSLTIYDGNLSPSNELLSSSCGSQIQWPSHPSTLLSTGTRMTVVFTSDDTISATGFRATFQQVAPREEFFLVVDGSNGKIYKQNRLGTDVEDLLVAGLQRPVAVDFDPVDQKVYFTDVNAKFIGRINIDGSDQQTIATDMVDVPDGLVVDSKARILYWTDTGNDMITKSNLDGSERSVFINTDLDEPRDIILHQEGGYVYWTDWGNEPKIERCFFDGSGRTAIINEDLGWPNGLALDKYENKLYWADALLNQISRSNFDGSQRQLLEDFDSNDVHPFSIVVLETAIYWTDWLTQGIDVTDRNFQNEASTLHVAGIPTRLHDIVFYSSESISQICGGTLNGLNGEITSPGYPYAYSNDGNCIWTIEASSEKVIQLTVHHFDLQDSLLCLSDSLTIYDGNPSPLNVLLSPSCGSQLQWPSHPSTLLSTGTRMTIVFTSDDTITATGFRATFQQVAPREEFFLVADGSNGKIYKQNRLGTDVEDLLVAGLLRPVAVDFDPVDRKVYFTDVIAKFIGRINIDGSDQQTIATEMVDVPDGIVVDSEARILYWTDTGNDMITKSNLDGSDRSVFVSTDLDEPRDIIIYQEGGYVYWTDWGNEPKIERCLFDGSVRTPIIKQDLGWPNGLALDKYENKLYWADARLNQIERSNFDGSQRQLLEDFDSDDVHPFSIVVLETAIVWTDWLTQGIDVTDRSFQNEASTLHVAGIATRLHDIVFYSSESRNA